MGLFQSVFSISDEADADLDPFQCQEGTYKKLDIDAVAAAAKALEEQATANKKSAHKIFLTAPRRKRKEGGAAETTTRNGKRVVALKSRHSEKVVVIKDRPKPIVLGPEASLTVDGPAGYMRNCFSVSCIRLCTSLGAFDSKC